MNTPYAAYRLRVLAAAGFFFVALRFVATISLGQQAGRYELVVTTRDASGKNIDLKIEEIALGY